MNYSEEDAALLLKLQQGDESVVEKLVENCEPMIHKVAVEFANSGLSESDLYDVGRQALVRLAKSEIGNTGREHFFRFGAWCVRQEMYAKVGE
jgi:DNA-directed RNA polymerase specialized sigma subunit